MPADLHHERWLRQWPLLKARLDDVFSAFVAEIDLAAKEVTTGAEPEAEDFAVWDLQGKLFEDESPKFFMWEFGQDDAVVRRVKARLNELSGPFKNAVTNRTLVWDERPQAQVYWPPSPAQRLQGFPGFVLPRIWTQMRFALRGPVPAAVSDMQAPLNPKARSNLTDDDVRAIRRDPRIASAIAVSYGISRTAVGDIKRGKSWAHVADE